MMTLLFLWNLFILLALLVALAVLLLNLAAFPTVQAPEEEDEGGEMPFVSVLVPARNEVLRIGPCAQSLMAQDYPAMEVIIMDDNSTDGTAELLYSMGWKDAALEPNARFRVMRGQPLPAGWSGKSWACQQLAEAAKGESILFLDADTEHAPQMLRAAMAFARKERADLLSAWPFPETGTWSEKLVLPLIHMALIGYPQAIWRWLIDVRPDLLARLPEGVRRGFGAANGQFLLFRAEVYRQIGGHAACRSHMVEDVALGRAMAAAQLRLINADGSKFSSVRMYHRFSEVWEGFTKNMRAAFENSLGVFILTGAGTFATLALPFLLVWFCRGGALWLALAQIAVIYLMRVILTLRFGTTWLGCLLHPAGQILMTFIGLNSWRLSAGRGVTWKGRRYDVVHPSEEKAKEPAIH